MAQIPQNVKIRFRRPGKLVTAVVCGGLVFCLLVLMAVNIGLSREQKRLQELLDQAQGLEQENSQLEDKIDSVGSVDSMEQIAKDELGLVDPDSVIVQPSK